MSGWTPDVSGSDLIDHAVIQGFAMGFIFNPMTVMAFTTLPAASARRRHRAAEPGAQHRRGDRHFHHLASTLAHNTQVSHADLAAGITPFNRVPRTATALPPGLLDPATGHGARCSTR